MATPTKTKLAQLKLKAEKLKHQHVIAKAKDDLKQVNEQLRAITPARKE